METAYFLGGDFVRSPFVDFEQMNLLGSKVQIQHVEIRFVIEGESTDCRVLPESTETNLSSTIMSFTCTIVGWYS